MNENGLIIFQLSFFGLTVMFHLLAMCSKPGNIQKPQGIQFIDMMKSFDPVLLCPDCEVIRTDRSRHCSICNKCVERFDHHCPWINNCVGINNHGYFMGFLLSMLILLVTTFFSLVFNFDALNNIDTTTRAENNFFYNFILPKTLYTKEFLLPILWLDVLICGIFMLGVCLLTYV